MSAGATIGTPTDVWKWVLDVDLFGVIYGVNAFVPLFVEQNEGHVINTASLAGLSGFPGMGPYCTAKMAVVGLTESLFHELALVGFERGRLGALPGVRAHADPRVRAQYAQEIASYADDPTAQMISGRGGQAVNAGIDASDVAIAVDDAVRANKFWILHPRAFGDSHDRDSPRVDARRAAAEIRPDERDEVASGRCRWAAGRSASRDG